MRRMDRYVEEETEDRVTRSGKNQQLYENIGKNTRYTNLADVTNMNVYDLTNYDHNNGTRENYQKMREYSNLIPGPKVKRELEEFKNIYKVKENRVYDINSVMAEARKNRTEPDDKEAKRKLKNEAYNILLNLNKEELEEYRKKRKEKYTHPDEDELHELIDTITSKTLAGEIDKNTSVDLLSELMATSLLDKIQQAELNRKEEKDMDDSFFTDSKLEITTYEETVQIEEPKKEETKKELDDDSIEEKRDEEKEEYTKEDTELVGTDTDFYTLNMNLSKDKEKDENGMDDEFREKSLPLPLKILFFLIFVGIIAAVVYFVWQM